MVKIYTVAGCSSCRKAIEWFKSHDIDYCEVNLVADQVTESDILQILSLTENGTEDIISRRSKAYSKLAIDFDSISVKELVNLIEENRTLLRRPLIVDDRRLQVGYNEDDIRKFLPRDVRTIELNQAIDDIRMAICS